MEWVHIAVVGDGGVGKTTLIRSYLEEAFPEQVSRTVPPITFVAEGVKTKIYDTCGEPQNAAETAELEGHIKRADSICLVYNAEPLDAVGLPREEAVGKTRASIRRWLQRIRQLREGKSPPVILVGTHIDVRVEGRQWTTEEEQAEAFALLENHQLDDEVGPLISEYPEIDGCWEVSCPLLINVAGPFVNAHKTVLYPLTPLWDTENKKLTPLLRDRLLRIFRLCDQDRDGCLNDAELKYFQHHSFGMKVGDAQLEEVKRVAKHKSADYVDEVRNGLTFEGFVYLHLLWVEMREEEVAWHVLHEWGYVANLRLAEDFLCPPHIYTDWIDEQDVMGTSRYLPELTAEAVEWLREVAGRWSNERGLVPFAALSAMFELCELQVEVQCPWDVERVREGLIVPVEAEGLSPEAFVALWNSLLSDGSVASTVRAVRCATWLGYENEPEESEGAVPFVAWQFRREIRSRHLFHALVLGGSPDLRQSLARRVLLSNMPQQHHHHHNSNGSAQKESYSVSTALQQDLFVVAHCEENAQQALAQRNAMHKFDSIVLLFESQPASWEQSRAIAERIAGDSELQHLPVLFVCFRTTNDLKLHAATKQRAAQYCSKYGVAGALVEVVDDIEVGKKLGAEVVEKLMESFAHPKRFQLKGTRMLSVVGGAVVIAAVVGVGYYLWSKSQEPKPDELGFFG